MVSDVDFGIPKNYSSAIGLEPELLSQLKITYKFTNFFISISSAHSGFSCFSLCECSKKLLLG